MAVHLTRIYTRTGDEGTTTLGDLSRVAKTDARIGALADVDAANAALGVAVALGLINTRHSDITDVVYAVQNDLFDVGADLATPQATDPAAPTRARLRITTAYVDRLEGWCDEYNERLGALTSFVLPGGTPSAALLHAARTSTRRAERSTWALMDQADVNPVAVHYLNRLSDLLFILARCANDDDDVLWEPGRAPQ